MCRRTDHEFERRRSADEICVEQAGDPSYTAPKRWQPELLVETLESPNAPKIATQAS